MTAKTRDENRDVIPRWRRSIDIASFVEAASPKTNKIRAITSGPARSPMDVMGEFRASGKPLVWAEALSIAIANRDLENAIAIANDPERPDLGRHPILRTIADEEYLQSLALSNNIARIPNVHDHGAELRAARKSIRSFSSNALAWLDLARAHAINGNPKRAERAVLAALRFDSNSRWIVRAAARFFVHSNDKEKGLGVIERAKGHKVDPWLISAHIAISHTMNRSSPLIKKARGILESDDFRPKATSELGMAFATLEVSNSVGASRLINKLARRALRDPTENAVAQAEWIESITGRSFGASQAAEDVSNAFEARAKDLMRRKDWEGAANETFQWLRDQPFSSRPAIDGSYIAATFLRRFDLAADFAAIGYRANPKDPLVRNNLAVALAELGEVPKARRVFDSLGDPANADFCETFRATEALLRYRERNIESARILYRQCRESLLRTGDAASALLSTLYQAQEEIRLGNITESLELIKLGEHLGSKANEHEVTRVLRSLMDDLSPKEGPIDR